MKKLSNLVPEEAGKEINVGIWNEHTPYENKLELWEGIPWGEDGMQRDRLSICLIYSMGLKHLLDILPNESKSELLKLLKEEEN
ncbi:hypothetical protein [Clostridium saccharobutylicum]|uniref:Uncharacterized protein n=1 Tax=Clostridium saccharobutylicum TaxID=169679 RepID=A0A1S8MYW1_CLOSA|nr:hypothetical protein [Clostridium saccharobutylicum]OOM09416.1 hypothetical protein CLOSAC_36970 [Clostridium saccharobutylicum]